MCGKLSFVPDSEYMEQEADRWRELFRQADLLPTTASPWKRRQRGRDFEQILRGMLAEAELAPRANFRPRGEEIDGSFLHRDRVMLLEAKWTQDPLPASSIYEFRGKVEGKVCGTIGVFISMSGFSKDAVNALVAGKTINTILFNGDDMRAIAARKFSIGSALDQKLRAAADEGTPFWPLSDPMTFRTVASSLEGAPARVKVVVVEGRSDAFLVHTLADELGSSVFQLVVLPAGGVLNLSAVANVVRAAGNDVVIIADGDGDRKAIRRLINDDLEDFGPGTGRYPSIFVFDRTLEEELGLVEGFTGRQPRGLEFDPQRLREDIRRANIPVRAERNPKIRELLAELGIPEQTRSR